MDNMENQMEQKLVEYHNVGDMWIQAPDANLVAITGSGGGGKGGGGGSARAAVEAANTLQASAVVKVVEILSEGQIEGLCGGAKGIYINDTPLQNSDNSYNFTKVIWDYRVGLPSQDYMQGFSNVEAEISVATPVTIVSNNIVRTTSATNIDAVRITIQLPNGLSEQNTSNGDINGSSVQFRIDKKLTSSGTWTTVNTFTITGKTTNAYEAQYLIDRIGPSGTWDVRVTRITADPSATVQNATRFERLTEIQYIQLTYDDTAYVGISIAAESVGNSIPKRAYLVKGLRVQIPSNYNPVTRAYTGTWDGTFTTAWTDNPAWCLYDMLTNTRYGMGEYISASDVEKYSFYDAAVYNDELVDNGASGAEPRFTLNCRIAAQDQFWRIAQMIAGNMRSNLLWVNNKYMVIQDRPSSPVKTISKDNVINGKFKRKGSTRDERHTAFNITWNNRADRHLQVVSTVEDTDGIARYGYFPSDIAAFGATTEGQAIRAGKWALYTELNQVHQVSFEMSFDGFDLLPGDVIKVLDEDWANIQQAGRITTAASGTTVVLDRPITITSGSSISVNMPNGSGIQTRNIVETSGTLSTVTISSAFSSTLPAYTQFIIETATVVAKQFKIINLKQTDVNIVEVQCVEHDPNKYNEVETGFSVPDPVFTNAVNTVVGVPTSIVFAEESVIQPNGVAQRNVRVSWTPPTGTIKGYTVNYYRNDASITSEFVGVPRILINATLDGTYNFKIYAVDFNDNQSGTSLDGTYVVDSTVSAGTTLGVFNAVDNLYVTGTSGTAWTTDDLTVTWIDDPANTAPASGYKVEILTTSDVVLQSEIITEKTYLYPIAKNIADGGPRNQLKVRVYPQDASYRFGPANTTTFTNAAPAAVTGMSVAGSFKSVGLTWNASTESDVKGYLVWRSTSAGFTPSAGNLVSDQLSSTYNDVGLADTTAYYYKVAAYDVFSRSVTASGLNVTASSAVTTLDASNTNEYLLNGVTWTPNSPTTNSVAWSAATMTKTNGTSSGTQWSITAGNAAWTSGVLYIYYTEGNTTLQSTTTVGTAIANNKIIVATYRGGTNLEVGNGKAYIDGGFIIAGTVAAAQLVTGTAVITQTAQIADTIISTAKIIDANITGAKIANLTVDTVNLKNGSITDVRSFVSNASTTLTSSSSVGTSNISSVVVAELIVTTPNPTGLAGPFSSYIHASLVTNTRVNGSISVGGIVNYGDNVTNTSNLSVVGTPTWRLRIIKVSDGSVVATTDELLNGSGVKLGSISVGGTVNYGDNVTNTANVTAIGGGGINLLFLAPNLLKNTQYSIQIVTSGQLVVSKNTTSTPISVTADQRAIYYQCILR